MALSMRRLLAELKAEMVSHASKFSSFCMRHIAAHSSYLELCDPTVITRASCVSFLAIGCQRIALTTYASCKS